MAAKSKDLLEASTVVVCWFQMHCKVILFWVKVPVLSEQIMLAPPMVSQD